MQLNGEGEEGDSLHGAAKRMSKAPPAPVAIFSKDYFTEVEAWLNAKAKAREDYEKYSKGEFEITCSTARADSAHRCTGALPCTATNGLGRTRSHALTSSITL